MNQLVKTVKAARGTKSLELTHLGGRGVLNLIFKSARSCKLGAWETVRNMRRKYKSHNKARPLVHLSAATAVNVGHLAGETRILFSKTLLLLWEKLHSTAQWGCENETCKKYWRWLPSGAGQMNGANIFFFFFCFVGFFKSCFHIYICSMICSQWFLIYLLSYCQHENTLNFHFVCMDSLT